MQKACQCLALLSTSGLVSGGARGAMARGLGTGGAGGARAPLELRFNRVKIFKIGKISFFVLLGLP